MALLTDKTLANDDDLRGDWVIHVVDPSDTTDSPDGSSFQIYGSAISICTTTASSLNSLIAGSDLIPGRFYRIAAFSVMGNETVIFQAVGANKIGSRAYSGINGVYTDIILLDTTDSDCTNWTVIYREDPIRKLSAHYDWRNEVFTVWETSAGSGIYTSFTDPGGGAASKDFYTFDNDIDISGGIFNTSGILSPARNIHLGYGTTSTIFGGECSNITIGASGYDNIICNSSMSNRIGDGFNNVIAGKEFSYNTLADNFRVNTFGDSCQYNTFIGDVYDCVFPSSTKRNAFNCDLTSVNFSSATHIKQSYFCELFVREGGNQRLKYVNSSDVLTYASITA